MSARDELIERAARAYYEWACGLDDDFGDSDPSRWDVPDALGLYPHKEFARERAAVFLDAFMAEPVDVLDLLVQAGRVEQLGWRYESDFGPVSRDIRDKPQPWGTAVGKWRPVFAPKDGTPPAAPSTGSPT